jgi:hypothetical protein
VLVATIGVVAGRSVVGPIVTNVWPIGVRPPWRGACTPFPSERTSAVADVLYVLVTVAAFVLLAVVVRAVERL